MKIIAQSGLRYIPKWNKNRKLPEDEQIVIDWNYLSGTDREIIYGIKPIDFDIESGKIAKTMSYQIDNVDLLKRSIEKVINLEVDDIGIDRPATVDDICNMSGLGGLYTELKNFFTDMNTETEKKN